MLPQQKVEEKIEMRIIGVSANDQLECDRNASDFRVLEGLGSQLELLGFIWCVMEPHHTHTSTDSSVPKGATGRS